MVFQIPKSILDAHQQLNAMAVTGNSQLQQRAARLVGGCLCGSSDISQVSVVMPGWKECVTVQKREEGT